MTSSMQSVSTAMNAIAKVVEKQDKQATQTQKLICNVVALQQEL